MNRMIRRKRNRRKKVLRRKGLIFNLMKRKEMGVGTDAEGADILGMGTRGKKMLRTKSLYLNGVVVNLGRHLGNKAKKKHE